jgi:UDP-N-acetylglucosamine--N-acetylmuramyl-(pentapeptide) pyrophosphoryl-undecaprenol N-acetylglucosamine transferase
MEHNILIATGGTGGHIFPAIALMNKLKESGAAVKLTADAKFSRYCFFDENHILIPAASFSSKSLKGILLTLVTLMHGFLKALYCMYKYNPDIVIGFGGYATYPMMLAAILFNKKIILHEANTVIGKVNRLLLWRAKYLTTGFKSIYGVKPKYQHKIIYTGNPVRSDVLSSVRLQLKDKISILIIGGSQGAKIFSKIIPAMVINLPAEVKDKLFIYQQVKQEDIAIIEEIYTKEGIGCEIKSFFTDMNDKLGKANLVIARSGASTIAELIAVGLPSILIPLPSSADNHQYYNAKEIADMGASWLVVEEPNVQSSLLKIVKSVCKDLSLLDKCSSKLKNLQQDACQNIIEVIKKLP